MEEKKRNGNRTITVDIEVETTTPKRGEKRRKKLRRRYRTVKWIATIAAILSVTLIENVIIGGTMLIVCVALFCVGIAGLDSLKPNEYHRHTPWWYYCV